MSDKLYLLGKWAFAHKWRVFIVWIVIIAGLGITGMTLKKPYSTSFSIPGTEAQKTLDTLSKGFPAASGGTGTIVFAVPAGHTIAQNKAAIETTMNQISKVNGVVAAYSPFISQTISKDGRVAYASVQLKDKTLDVTTTLKNQVATILKNNKSSSLEIEQEGDTLAMDQVGGSSSEAGGVIVAALVLLITFGSLVAAGMPLLIAIVAVLLGMFSVQTATSFLTLSSTASILSLMLGLAVGIDYSLFLITRFIKYVKEGASPQEAAGRMVATAGNAVIFAALTVIIALVALNVVGIPFLGNMGTFAAITVAFAALAALTLVPAFLSFAKLKVLRKKDRVNVKANVHIEQGAMNTRSFSFKWVSFITKRPIIVVIVAVLLLAAAAIPASKLYLGLPGNGTAAKTSTERKAYDLLSQGFGPGFNGPLIVVASLPSGLTTLQTQTELGTIASNLGKENGVKLAVPAGVSKDGRTAIIQVVPTTGPDSIKTRNLITQIRQDDHKIAGNSTDIGITGTTAVAVDINTKLTNALPLYLIVVVGLSLIILLVVFRSIIVPLKATLGFVLTILATLGLIVGVFQLGWFNLVEAGPVLSFLPILVTGIVFGLAMDYEFFLVSGMHEEYANDKDKDAKKAIVGGFVHGSKVVTAAATIMIAVFTGFIFTNDNTTRSIGFALAAGVFIDAFIVRMTIVPAVMALFGRKAWWLPKWLGRILPNLSIEGDEKAFEKLAK